MADCLAMRSLAVTGSSAPRSRSPFGTTPQRQSATWHHTISTMIPMPEARKLQPSATPPTFRPILTRCGPHRNASRAIIKPIQKCALAPFRLTSASAVWQGSLPPFRRLGLAHDNRSASAGGRGFDGRPPVRLRLEPAAPRMPESCSHASRGGARTTRPSSSSRTARRRGARQQALPRTREAKPAVARGPEDSRGRLVRRRTVGDARPNPSAPAEAGGAASRRP